MIEMTEETSFIPFFQRAMPHLERDCMEEMAKIIDDAIREVLHAEKSEAAS